jgi:hypothetical protein
MDAVAVKAADGGTRVELRRRLGGAPAAVKADEPAARAAVD